MRTYLGSELTEGLYPSAVGFDRCIYLLFTDQANILLLVALIVLVKNPHLKLLAVVVFQSIFFLIQYAYLRVESRHLATMRLLKFASCIFACYFQFIVQFETVPLKYTSVVGWCFIGLTFALLVISHFQKVALSL